MDKKALIETLARESNEKGGFTGTWLYAEKGEIISKGAVGFRDPEHRLLITEDTIFQLASVSKQFTAAAVMLLVRRGLLHLDDKITAYFPELTAYGEVTIRHLLNHTAGVPDYFGDMDWFFKIWREENRVPGNDEIPRFLCETRLKPSFAPGEKIDYSNTGYNLLALLVERLSGVAYEDFLQQNIFEPAGMNSTRCCHIRRDGIPFENFARAMVIEEGKYVTDVDSVNYRDVVAFDGLNGDDYVYTNIFDMFTWDRALREGKVLTPGEQQLMYTPGKLGNGETAGYDEDEGLGYGFGWATGRDQEFGLIVSHSGGMPGVITWFERFIEADRVLVLLSNCYPEDYRAFMGFDDGIQKIARDQEPGPVQTIEEITIQNPDKTKWADFCGKYEHIEGADFIVDEVRLQDGELYVKAIDEELGKLDFKLYPIGEDEFGRKEGMLKVKFGDGCVVYDDHTCKKL